MSWLLVERLVQVNDDDIGMPRNVKEIREDLDRLPIFHLRLWRLCQNLLLRCFNECVRDIINLRRPFWNPNLHYSNRWGFRVARGCDTESDGGKSESQARSSYALPPFEQMPMQLIQGAT